MNLHEYQSKQLFREYGIPVPQGLPAHTPDDAAKAAQEIGGELWAVKAQVHAGGRGKGGGIKLARSAREVKEAAQAMLGTMLVTPQTGPEGLPVNTVFVEQGSNIDRELYLSLLIDRETERTLIMASAAGGMNIEEVAVETPEKIFTTSVNPAAGVQSYQARRLGFGMGLDKAQTAQFTKIVLALYKVFLEKDASLIEVNPLIVTGNGSVMALDAKINIDDNALFRQPRMLEWRDPSQEDEKENEASAHDLNYVSLDGDIACMVNGAGLAMATMDLIKLHGGQPANFLDVGGGATAERVTEAFKLILSNENVKVIMVNIFGGIVHCDIIAEGIMQAVKGIGVTVPVVARLEGTNVEKGMGMLAESGLDIVAAESLTDAAQKAVKAAGG